MSLPDLPKRHEAKRKQHAHKIKITRQGKEGRLEHKDGARSSNKDRGGKKAK